MTQSTLLRHAKQGNPTAIATLINRHARHQGVVAHVSLQGDCLHVILEGQEPPLQTFWSHYLERALSQLGTTAVRQLQVYGRCYGAKHSAWSETIALGDNTLVTAPAASVPSASMPTVSIAVPPSRPSSSAVPDNSSAWTFRTTAVPVTKPQPSAWLTAGAKADCQRQSPAPSRRSSSKPSVGLETGRWRSLLQTLTHLNLALALQWLGSMLLVGGGAAGLHAWGRSSGVLAGLGGQVPQFALIALGLGALGWLSGQIQATLLNGWVVSSDRWTVVTVLGAVLGWAAGLLTGAPVLALPILAVFQWTALRQWQSQAYGWIVVHSATAIAALMLMPLLRPAAVGWGNTLSAGYFETGHGLTADVALLWLFYSGGGALAAGKVFYRP